MQDLIGSTTAINASCSAVQALGWVALRGMGGGQQQPGSGMGGHRHVPLHVQQLLSSPSSLHMYILAPDPMIQHHHDGVDGRNGMGRVRMECVKCTPFLLHTLLHTCHTLPCPERENQTGIKQVKPQRYKWSGGVWAVGVRVVRQPLQHP